MKGDTSLPLSSKHEYGRETNSSGIQSGQIDNEDPRQQIYKTILFNIKMGVYDTKPEYYKVGKVIGKGAFGKVNLAIHRLTGKFVALKSISKAMMSDESSLKKVRQEYNILKRARH
jgi:serine/threonine protein kinase